MTGVQYVTDDKGKKVAVQIDLRRHSRLWEDFYDTMLAEARANEPRMSLDSVKLRLASRSNKRR